MAIVGPAVAAGLVALAGWRAMFLVNVPLCALAALFAWNRFPGRRDDAQVLRFDVRGIVLLGAFTAVSLVGLSSFSITAAVAVAVAVVLAGLYWIHTARAEAPVLERQFFARMPLRGIHLASAAVFGGCLGLNAFLPLYVQGGLRHSSGIAAASLLFLSAGWSLGSIGVSRLLTRRSPVDTALAGFGFVIPGVALGLVFLGPGAPIGAVWIIALVQGLGVGIVSTSLLTHLQRQITETGVGRANAAHQYARNLAYTYCAAIVGAVVLLVVGRRLGDVEPVQRLLAGDEGDLRRAHCERDRRRLPPGPRPGAGDRHRRLRGRARLRSSDQRPPRSNPPRPDQRREWTADSRVSAGSRPSPSLRRGGAAVASSLLGARTARQERDVGGQRAHGESGVGVLAGLRAAGGVDTGDDAVARARVAYGLDRVGVLARTERLPAAAHADRQVGRADVDAVDPGRRADGVGRLDGPDRLDHHEARDGRGSLRPGRRRGGARRARDRSCARPPARSDTPRPRAALHRRSSPSGR